MVLLTVGPIEDAGAAADDGFAFSGNPVGKPEARSDIVPVCRKGANRCAVDSGESHHSRGAGDWIDGDGIERVHLVADDPSREFDVIPHAGIDGQPV